LTIVAVVTKKRRIAILTQNSDRTIERMPAFIVTTEARHQRPTDKASRTSSRGKIRDDEHESGQTA